MPEGDSIHRTAATLRAALVGHRTLTFEAPRLVGRHPGAGATVEAVESIGKHLEIRWTDGVVVRTHMRMSGSWHLYRPGDRWRLPRRDARVIVTTDDWTAVCFRAPDVECYESGGGVVPAARAHLGPDLCRADVDLAECVRRMVGYRVPDRSIAEVLLDQRVACGVGNVFKSEVLFACRVHPFEPVATIGAARAAELIEMATRLLRSNLDGGRRTTITSAQAPGGLAVYRRAGRPCPVCGTGICVRRHGEHARSTYWCPHCQPAPGAAVGTNPSAGSLA